MDHQVSLDPVDLEILRLLQEDARMPNAEIGRRIGTATSTVFARLKRLKEAGVVRAFEARLDPGAVGLGVTAFVFLSATEVSREDDVEEALLRMPEVLELHKIAGNDSFLAKVRAPDNGTLGRRLREGVESASVSSIRTIVVLATALERTSVDLSHLDPTE